MSNGEITVGAFTIGPPSSEEDDAVGIFNHATGEGADFSKEEFEEMIAKFYEENF